MSEGMGVVEMNNPKNEYEYSKLVEAANKAGRSKLNAICWAILKLAEDE